MKSRYLILLSLIVAIGSVGCTGLLDDPGQITIDGAPGAALEDPDSEVQGIGSKELTFSCPTPDVERDMTELAKLLPKECGGKEGEIVLLADLSSMLENETIREFVIGMVQRSQTEDALKKIIDEDNLSQFPYGMSKYDRINYYNSKTEKEKEALQKRARESEMVNAMNDEMLSFILNLVGSQTDFAMCATIDDDATKDNSSNLGNTAPARGTAQSMGLGLRNLVMAKTAQGNAAAEETEPEEAAQRMNYTTSRYYDEENLNLMVIVTDDSNAAEAFAELQDKLRKRDEFKDLNLDSESLQRVQDLNEKIKSQVSDSDCELMNKDGEFICKRREVLENGRTMFAMGNAAKLGKMDQMQRQKNAETLYADKEFLQVLKKSNSPLFRFAIRAKDPSSSNKAELIIGVNTDTNCADMGISVNDKPVTNAVMTIPTLDIAMILNSIPIELSDDSDSSWNGRSDCDPAMLYNEETVSEDYQPAEPGVVEDSSYPSMNSLSAGEDAAPPTYSHTPGSMNAEAPANVYIHEGSDEESEEDE